MSDEPEMLEPLDGGEFESGNGHSINGEEPEVVSPEPAAAETLEALPAAEDAPFEPAGGPPINIVALGAGAGAILAVIIALVVLFLPPLNLAAQLRGCQSLTGGSPTILGDNGITAQWSGQDTRLCFDSVSADALMGGQGGGALNGATEALPSYLQLVSPIYMIEYAGAQQAVLEIAVPPDAGDFRALDLYRWDREAGQWVFVPGHVDPATGIIRTDSAPDNLALFRVQAITPLIGTTLEANQAFDQTTASSLNLVLPTGLVLQPDGSLSGQLTGGWQLGTGYAVVPVIRANDPSLLTFLLNDPASLALHIDDLKTFVVGDGYNGVAIDYTGVAVSDREAFSVFVADLASALHEYNKMVIVILPAPANIGGTWDTGGYDWRAIGAAADMIVVSPGNNPADFAVNGSADAMLGWAVGEISRLKLAFGMSSLSAEEQAGAFLPLSYEDALLPLGNTQTQTAAPEGTSFYAAGSPITFGLSGNVADLVADQNTGAYVYSATTESGQRRIWIVTSSTIRARLDMASSYNIGGMMINNLMAPGNDAGLLTAINEFKSSAASTIPSTLVIQWTVTGASGAALTQTTGLGTPMVWQPDTDGEYTVQGAIVGAHVSDRGSVGVQVGAPPTTAPPPTVIVTSAPSRNTPAPTQAATTTPPPPVSGGVVGGGFELGGQTHDLSHPGQMHQAGMTWVKFQHKWTPGDDPGAEAGRIALAHNNGFRVLFSVPGPLYPTSIDYNAYVAYVRGLASLGADGIEIWNEMNLAREWPANDISGASYVNNMLAPAYNAIKGANPNVLVISGAPAPSGFWGGCGNLGTPDTTGCDDWQYLIQMRDASASRYMDCMGVHFNSGATSPNATTGHPADQGDHHYTWYYRFMYNTYYGTIGKPLCFTELGYVSPDGYGQLPSNFWWGGQTSVDEHAQWLAETAVLASQSGQVRLMIIFNVDFTVWETYDPQAGYAMIRPGGACPACIALDGVMP